MFFLILCVIRSAFLSRRALFLENIALRHQLEVYNRGGRRPKIKNRDRILWTFLRRWWGGWRRSLYIVQPATVVGWHREGFQLYWRWRSSTRKRGRPRLRLGTKGLLHRIVYENPEWGAPRVHGELKKLGILIGESTVSKYMRTRRPPPQGWKIFLTNHANEIASVDFFTVNTVTMRTLYCFVVLSHERRKILACGVTDSPTGAWAAELVARAFRSAVRAPTILLRDQDKKYGNDFNQRMEELGVRQVRSAYRCPWQNGYVERVIGTLRRECLDHVIVFNRGHLQRVLDEYVAYYNESRTHLGLDKDCPIPRRVEPPSEGEVVGIPVLGGLHHRYTRRAA